MEEARLIRDALRWRDQIELERHRVETGALDGRDAMAALVLEDRVLSIEEGYSPIGLDGVQDVPGKGQEAAGLFHEIATGAKTPVDLHLEDWLAESAFKPNTKRDHRRAFRVLQNWLQRSKHPSALETLNDRVAATFKKEEPVAKSVHPKSANKMLSAFRTHWRWLTVHGYPNIGNP